MHGENKNPSKLEPDKNIGFLNGKSLYTNVPVNEAIEIALRSLYSGNHATEMSRSTLKMLLKLVVKMSVLKT